MPPASPLSALLHTVARRYRIPRPRAAALATDCGPGAALARAIEQLQAARAAGQPPDPALREAFIAALASLVRAALRPEDGDPAFQAMVLEHRYSQVREFLALRRQEACDRRQLRTAVDALAHPRKPSRVATDAARALLADLHATATAAAWPRMSRIALALEALPEVKHAEGLAPALRALLQSPALARLERIDALSQDPRVRQYTSIREKQGPRAGSDEASAQGQLARQRGVAVEVLATRALEAVARYLDQTRAQADPDGPGNAAAPRYRVVTSLRVPAELAADADRAKTEWDAVLLRRAEGPVSCPPLWDICLVVEAKASVEAATTDLPRLLRGLRLLARAQSGAVYAFATQQGRVQVRGASLATLPTREAALADAVLYCCDAPADGPFAPLNAASRMQLLSAPASLAYATALAEGGPLDADMLEPLWLDLQRAARWQPLLGLAAMRERARSLMVHPDDLLAAVVPAPA